MKKVRFKSHAKDRLCERVNCPISHKTIAKEIGLDKHFSVKKLTNSRTLCYVVIDGTPVKIVYSKSCKKVVTILPFKFDYQYDFDMEVNGNSFRITIFPDCFMETDNPYLLTRFYKLDNAGAWSKCKMSCDTPFQIIFQSAWEKYNLEKSQGNGDQGHENAIAKPTAQQATQISSISH